MYKCSPPCADDKSEVLMARKYYRIIAVLLIAAAFLLNAAPVASGADANSPSTSQAKPADAEDALRRVKEEQDTAAALEMLLDIVSAPGVSDRLVLECLSYAWQEERFDDDMMIKLLRAVAALDRSEFDEERQSLIVMLFLTGHEDEARRMLSERVEKYKEDVGARVDQAQMLYEYGGTEEALAAAEEALKDFAGSPELWLIRSWALEDAYRFGEAVESTQKAIELRRGSGEDMSYMYYHLYITAKRAGQYETATRALERVLAETASSDLFLKRANYRLWDLFDPRAALKDLDALIRKDPSLSDAYHSRMFAYFYFQQYEDALADALEIARLAPHAGRLAVGIAQMNAGMLEDSRASLTEYIEADPTAEVGYLYRAMLALYYEDNAQAAADDLEKALELSPNDPIALSVQANWYENEGNLSAAEAHYLKAAEYSADSPRTLEELGLLYLKQGRSEDVRSTLSVMTAQYPGRFYTLWLNTMALASEGDAAGALAAFGEIERIFPYMAETNIRIGAVLAAMAGDTQRAADIVIEHPAEEPLGYNDEAYVYLVMGEYDKSRAAIVGGMAALESETLSPARYREALIALTVTDAEIAYAADDINECVDRMRAACEIGWFPIEARESWIMKDIAENPGYQALLEEYPVK